MKFIEKNEKYPVFTHYKPTQVDPNKNNSNISACTPSLMSFQQRNLSIDNWETRERFPEKHEILHNVKGLLDGQVDTNLLRAKLFDMGINNEEVLLILFVFLLCFASNVRFFRLIKKSEILIPIITALFRNSLLNY